VSRHFLLNALFARCPLSLPKLTPTPKPHTFEVSPMPFTPSPSSVFPTTRYSITSESKDAFHWQEPAPPAVPFYRKPAGSAPSPYVPIAPITVLGELEALKQKLNALQATVEAVPAAALADGGALPADADGQVWQGASYDSFAQYAGEAARVRSAGRLAFGSDRMKMDVRPAAKVPGEGVTGWRY
jgi:hypothetical protein